MVFKIFCSKIIWSFASEFNQNIWKLFWGHKKSFKVKFIFLFHLIYSAFVLFRSI